MDGGGIGMGMVGQIFVVNFNYEISLTWENKRKSQKQAVIDNIIYVAICWMLKILNINKLKQTKLFRNHNFIVISLQKFKMKKKTVPIKEESLTKSMIF